MLRTDGPGSQPPGRQEVRTNIASRAGRFEVAPRARRRKQRGVGCTAASVVAWLVLIQLHLVQKTCNQPGGSGPLPGNFLNVWRGRRPGGSRDGR